MKRCVSNGLLALATTIAASGATYYVATDGKPENDGSGEKPWPSIEQALSKVGGGHTILVKPGIYRGPIQISRQYAGTKAAPTVIKSEVKWKAIVTIWNGDGEVVANNILVGGQDDPLVLDENTRDVLVDYNLCSPKSARQGTHGITGNPMFVDAGKGLYWLRAESLARGKGASVHAPATDFWGRSRPKDQPVDLGAMPFMPELAKPEARQRFEFGWAYYRHGSGGTIPDVWVLPSSKR